MTKQKWEHLVVPLGGQGAQPSEIQSTLDVAGADGWELVAIRPWYGADYAFFKREKRPTQVPTPVYGVGSRETARGGFTESF